jgi:hypothetical protein
VTRTVRKAKTGAIVQSDTFRTTHDSWGRLHQRHCNDKVLAQLGYDAEGKVDQISLDGGGILSLRYDPLTKQRKGYDLDAKTWTSGVTWSLNQRGHIESELRAFGQQQTKRNYTYDARGFLETVTDGVVP